MNKDKKSNTDMYLSKFKYIHLNYPLLKNIPCWICTYIITHTPDNIHAEKYVGSTDNMRRRLAEHNTKNIISVDLYTTYSTEMTQSLERLLIKLIKPASNIITYPLDFRDQSIGWELDREENHDLKLSMFNNTVKIGYRYLKYINKDEKLLKFSNDK